MRLCPSAGLAPGGWAGARPRQKRPEPQLVFPERFLHTRGKRCMIPLDTKLPGYQVSPIALRIAFTLCFRTLVFLNTRGFSEGETSRGCDSKSPRASHSSDVSLSVTGCALAAASPVGVGPLRHFLPGEAWPATTGHLLGNRSLSLYAPLKSVTKLPAATLVDLAASPAARH